MPKGTPSAGAQSTRGGKFLRLKSPLSRKRYEIAFYAVDLLCGLVGCGEYAYHGVYDEAMKM